MTGISCVQKQDVPLIPRTSWSYLHCGLKYLQLTHSFLARIRHMLPHELENDRVKLRRSTGFVTYWLIKRFSPLNMPFSSSKVLHPIQRAPPPLALRPLLALHHLQLPLTNDGTNASCVLLTRNLFRRCHIR